MVPRRGFEPLLLGGKQEKTKANICIIYIVVMIISLLILLLVIFKFVTFCYSVVTIFVADA